MATVFGLFDELLKRGGTDLHLAPQRPPLARVRGELTPLNETVLSARDVEGLLLEVVTPAQRARLATHLDATFVVEHPSKVRFRARYYVEHGGMAGVFRRVPASVPSAAELGLPDGMAKLVEARSGLIVIVGPASSGKTTTAAWMIDRIHRARRCHVVTFEDPIEFVHAPEFAQVTQRQVGEHVSSMLVGLTNASREDADVVFASELSSEGEVDLALRLASSGALVITTVEANTREVALERLVSFGDAERRTRLRQRLEEWLAGVVVHDARRTVSVT